MLDSTARRSPLLASLPLAGTALACAFAPASAGASGNPPSCLAPADGARATAVARAARPDGTSELTEFQAAGGYRVTRCDRDGRFTVSQTVSPIVGPDGASVLAPTEVRRPGVTVAMLYGDPADPRWAADFRASGRARAAATIPATVAPPAPPAAQPLPAPPSGSTETGPADAPLAADTRPPRGGRGPQVARPGGDEVAVAAVAGDACTNTQYRIWETRWGTRDYDYYVNRSRFNYNDTSVASIVDGHENWDRTYNSCGLNDITDLDAHHLGSTAETIHSYPDGRSVADRGSLSSFCPGALACTWLFSDATGYTTETDQRYNELYTFTNVGAAGAYDYESVATHETGHSIGLDHGNSSNALTMYFQITAGTTYPRSLAKGDVLGMRARYP